MSEVIDMTRNLSNIRQNDEADLARNRTTEMRSI